MLRLISSMLCFPLLLVLLLTIPSESESKRLLNKGWTDAESSLSIATKNQTATHITSLERSPGAKDSVSASNPGRVEQAGGAKAFASSFFHQFIQSFAKVVVKGLTGTAHPDGKAGIIIDVIQAPSSQEQHQIRQETVKASEFSFDCLLGGHEQDTKGNVILLHGFLEWSSMYEPLMKILAGRGYRSLACDQRGYSKGARPGNVSDYNYNKLSHDVFDVAKAVFGDEKFHLVGHDHGAMLGWYTTASALGKQKILSYSALSVPHNDAFSAGLFGPTADLEQQCASQHMLIILEKGSSHSFCAGGPTQGFTSCDDFQKALWWYNGAMDAGILSAPASMSATQLLAAGYYSSAALRKTWGGTPSNGHAATNPTGDITVPALYVCGKNDDYVLCNRPFALKTKDYCKNGYTYIEADCGHDVFGCDKRVEDGIIRHIEGASIASNV